ncbi:MAG: universal stress protein [Acidimicrobiales bacterium]
MTNNHSEKKILVGVDGSGANTSAIRWAVLEAHARHEPLIALYAWHLPVMAYSAPSYIAVSPEESTRAGDALVEQAVGELASEFDVKYEIRSVEGPASKVLHDVASSGEIDLVVVGSRGHNAMTNLVLGSVSHALSHHTQKPLVIVPHDFSDERDVDAKRRVVVGVDGSDRAIVALQWAAEEAAIHDAALEVVVAWTWLAYPADLVVSVPDWTALKTAADEIMEKSLAQLHAPDLEIIKTVREGHPADVLVERAAAAHLLVVGSRGLGHAREVLLGSTSHYCAHRSQSPIAIIPSP